MFGRRGKNVAVPGKIDVKFFELLQSLTRSLYFANLHLSNVIKFTPDRVIIKIVQDSSKNLRHRFPQLKSVRFPRDLYAIQGLKLSRTSLFAKVILFSPRFSGSSEQLGKDDSL